MRFQHPLTRPLCFLLGMITAIGALPHQLIACPFCSAVSQTLRQEMAVMDAVVIATAVHSDATRNPETGEVEMSIEQVLKGDKLVDIGQTVTAIYYGDVKAGRRFLLSGVDPPQMQWSCLALSEKAAEYVQKIPTLPEDPTERLQFYYEFLQDEDTMLSRDAYDEFAIAPYAVIQELKLHLDHDQIIQWINDPELSTDRKRLYLTLLGICGSEADLPMLEQLLRSTQPSARGALDALIACYLTLAGENGLKLIDELLLTNHQAPYADTYAAIMAIRFHGTEGKVIDRSALVESLHHVLDRPDLADLVIPDLARWNDWTQVEKLTELFIKADSDNNWVRVPVVNYLRACPLPEAKAAIKELEKVDPASVRRASTFFAVPVPAAEPKPSSSSLHIPQFGPSPTEYAGTSVGMATAQRRITAPQPPAMLVRPVTEATNPWRMTSVLAMSLASLMIMQFLLLSGGRQAVARQRAR